MLSTHGHPKPWIFNRGYTDSDTDSLSASLMVPQTRSERLIGNSNPCYRWEQYYKTDEELKQAKKPVKKYFKRINNLVTQYVFIDRLLDSSLPHNLIKEYRSYDDPSYGRDVMEGSSSVAGSLQTALLSSHVSSSDNTSYKVKRTPKSLFKLPDEETSLLSDDGTDPMKASRIPIYRPEEGEHDSQSRTVKLAIAVNMLANAILLVCKIMVTVMTSSISVLASLVDAALDLLSSVIVWATTRITSRRDHYRYPVGRGRLEPIGILVFSIIMIASFCQVGVEGMSRLLGDEHRVVVLTAPAIAIMAGTVVIKGLCWVWCRLIHNSSVQMLAEDAKTDVIFNAASIVFPLVGYYADCWWLDPLGGVLLAGVIIVNWTRTSVRHVQNLTGVAATADEHSVLLYLTMRFARAVRQIQGLHAYHAGDALHVEVDIILEEHTPLRDSHDLGESLQYILESVPHVDRAFVHLDYAPYNLPTHLDQRADHHPPK